MSTFDPPLLPALQGSAFETQISLADDPPAYDEANKVLKVSISIKKGSSFRTHQHDTWVCMKLQPL